MKKTDITKLRKVFSSYPALKLVYLFGSRATGDIGPMSDYDFAIYCNSKDIKKIYDIKFSLQDKISRLFKTDAVDIVILNEDCGSELKFNIIKEGILIYEKEPYQLLVEPRIMNEYFDFHLMLKRHGLTKA